MSEKIKLSAEYQTVLERVCLRSGRNFGQTMTLLDIFFEEASFIVKEVGELSIPNFVDFKVQNRGGHLDKFYNLDSKGEKVYRKGEDGKRLMIKKVKFPSVKAHKSLKETVRGTRIRSTESLKYLKLKKVE
jgi:nucleoid DNA-binding protein